MTDRMNPEIKSKWVAALRSGEYEQGIGYLHKRIEGGTEAYCCLGVLCEVAIKEGLDLLVYGPSSDGDGVWVYGLTEVNAFPPAEVEEWAGLPDSDPAVIADDDRRSLAELNDFGYTFAEIADLIEEYL